MTEFGFNTAARLRHSCWPGRCGGVLLKGLMILLFILYHNSLGQQLRPGTDLASINDSTICSSVDIRNTLDTFNRLKGCRVVEGFVQILLFDNFNDSSFANVSFPELTEITDYLLLYRVNGLRSLGHIFPNLAVIRGQSLFFTYALVIFEMSSLQEIALYSLTDITQGLVRIDKNPSLCFANSIEWNLITHEKGENFIRNIRPENECPLCPGDDTNVHRDEKITEERLMPCPNSTRALGSDDSERNRHFCWNRHHCQKICKPGCKSCNDNGDCCDEKCLGGCSINATDDCTVCRNFTIGGDKSRQCTASCPAGFYEYLGRRCVTKSDCIGMKRPIQLQGGSTDEYPYKIFNKSCVLTCPSNYMIDKAVDNTTCVACKGRCRKECPGTNVDNLASAQQLRGCTKIAGSLEIQIRGGRNIVTELEENLNMIEEIDGYLKVVRSFPLVSLNFLKSLRVIGGNTLESDKYAFVVLDNQNLLDIWEWENRTLEIRHGRLFFHFNPKLCFYKIETLRQKANLPEFVDLEVASNSNGDKIACNVSELEVNVTAKDSKAVILNWNAFKMQDQRKLLGYVVYSIEAPYRNVTLYDGRDACGGDGWRVDDVGVQEDKIHYLMTHLKPYTQYAFYVKTTTIATYGYGAQSKIQYFRTRPDEPSKPRNLQIISNASDSFIIMWEPPQNPNGKIVHYIVTGEQHKDSNDEEVSNDRNYCNDPPLVLPRPAPEAPEVKPENETCVCEHDTEVSTSKLKEEGETVEQIDFEDALHNVVYVKNHQPSTRKKRNIGSESFPTNHKNSKSSATNDSSIKNVTQDGTDVWISFNFHVEGKNQLYINKLQHYTHYTIKVRACREVETEKDAENPCSGTTIKTAQTKDKEGADDIQKVELLANQTSDKVSFTWEEPPNPNGPILTYLIEYKRVTVENSKPFQNCITRKQFVENNSNVYSLEKLTPGNYSFRVAAKSHAGVGKYSKYIYFYIEPPSSGTTVQATIFGLIALLVLSSATLFYIKRKKYANSGPNMKLIASVNPEYVSTVYVPDEWEVPRKKIELHKELGQGSFGMVYEGVARDVKGKAQVRCAIKTVNEHATNRERIEFLKEASVMKAFDTAHVVRLLGVVSQGQPTLVVMELMANGDLKSYLRSHRPDVEVYNPVAPRQPPSLKRILQMAIEIADGMAYLTAKKFVHRDLAARNCMVAEDLTVKIGDFGMTRDIYETDYYRKGTKGLLPVRWMAPESLKDGVFTSSSDVWSYGVVLWEMATLASQPYQGLSNDQVLRYVIDGGVMERPENCPDKLYTLMKCCWQHKSAARPTFLELCALLLEDAASSFAQISFYHSAAGVEARNTRPTPSPSQDDPSTPLRVDRDLEKLSSSSSDEGSDHEFNLNAEEQRVQLSNYPMASKDSSATANGYASGHTTNGMTASQC